MKKRIMALLLSLVMALSLVPTTVWAAGVSSGDVVDNGIATQASMSWTWTVTIFGDNYYRSDGTKSNTNRYTTNQHLDNSKDNEIGYKFEWNASAGGRVYKGGWQLCITVNGAVVDRTTAYVYTRDMTTASGTWTAPGSSHTGNSSHPFTLYLSSFPEVTNNCNHDYGPWQDNGNGTHSKTCTKCSDKVTERHVDTDNNGICDKCGACLHDKNNEGYCTVDDCQHIKDGKDCCQKEAPKPPVDPIVGPKNDDLAKVNVTVTDKENKHPQGSYLLSGQFVKVNEKKYTVTVNADEYIAKYVTANGNVAHELDNDTTPKTVTFTYDENNKTWNPDVNTVNFNVKCETTVEKCPVYVAIYRNGNFEKLEKSVYLGEREKHSVITVDELNALNIADYYTAQTTGGYDYYGWYNDGMWNVYKKNPTNPPALCDIPVNGYTNIKVMVYDKEKVVYFQTKEALADYQNDHSKTEGLLYTTTARVGTELPTADAPTAERTGYKFTFWSKEGQTSDVTGQTVGGWTNLYANWKKQEYTVSSTLYLNGSTESCKDSRGVVISRTVKGLYEEPIDYATLKEALKKVALDADAANKPNQNKVDLKICWNDKSGREFDAKTYGQPGYNWREMQYQTKHWTVAYTWAYAWTYYDVTFDVNGGEGTIDAQLVKNGDKATEPTTVPTKDCHRFLGWFDADGNKFDFDKPITKSMTLYAKWELVEVNTYIIPRDSSNGMLNEDGGIPLNKDTLERVGLQDYAKNSGTEYQSILIGNFTSNAAIAEPDDYFDGDAEVVAAAKEMNAKLKLDAGINKATFDKNDILGKTEWTWLHVATGVKKDTEDYLSGDLMFYSAMFKTEDEENVTGMPKANYDTIYDYYIEGETITMPANPTRTGYDFKGWAVNGKTVDTTNGYTITGDVVFTAQWEKQTYTVKFDSKGGSTIAPQTVKYKDKVAEPKAPTKSGYTFDGWYTDEQYTTKYNFANEVTGNMTLYAKWDVKRTGTNPDAKNPYIKDSTTKTDGKKVESGKTFDAGIAMYVGLSILSVTGSAVVIRKRKDF